MIREICRDVILLGQKSDPATVEDMDVAQDLLDTLSANAESCVGMAANMIGVKKRIIAVNAGTSNMIMFNPVIIKKTDSFETTEGCLSLDGERETIRYKRIEVIYQDIDFVKKKRKFTGWTAQIIQHECDHLEGIII